MKRKKKSKGYKFGVFAIVLVIIFGVSITSLRKTFPRPYLEIVKEAGETYDLDTSLIYAVIHAESNFRETVVSSAGAKGLMQITDETGEFIRKRLDLADYTSEDLLDPKTNILMGAHYLNYLSGRFSEKKTILAAYNAGHKKKKKWLDDESMSDGTNLKIIPFEETKEYVDRVILRQKIYDILYWMK